LRYIYLRWVRIRAKDWLANIAMDLGRDSVIEIGCEVGKFDNTGGEADRISPAS